MHSTKWNFLRSLSFKADALYKPKLQLSYLFCAGKCIGGSKAGARNLNMIAQKQNMGKHVLHTNFNTLKSPNFTSPSNRQHYRCLMKSFVTHMSTEELFTSSGATVLATVLATVPLIRPKPHCKRLKSHLIYINYIIYILYIMHQLFPSSFLKLSFCKFHPCRNIDLVTCTDCGNQYLHCVNLIPIFLWSWGQQSHRTVCQNFGANFWW